MSSSYDIAKEVFADWGVDTEAALSQVATVPISVQCGQGDDVAGLEKKSGTSGGGLGHRHAQHAKGASARAAAAVGAAEGG